MRHRTYHLLLVVTALLAFGADQVSKYGMFRHLYDGSRRGEREVIPGWFRFTADFDSSVPPDSGFLGRLQTWSAPVMPHVNYGALFGIGSDYKENGNRLFTGVCIIALGFGVVFLWRWEAVSHSWWACLICGLLLGGTAGNLFDRVVFGGVRDFLYFYRVEFPVFNVADCCLVCGSTAMVLNAFLTPGSDPKSQEPKTEGKP